LASGGEVAAHGQAMNASQQLEEFIEFLPVAFVEFAWDGLLIQRMNYVARIISGYSTDDVAAGLPITALVAPESMALFFEHGASLIAHRTRADGGYARRPEQNILEATLVRKDGTTFPAEIQGSMVLDDKGHPIGAQVMGRDISKRKAAEAEQLRLMAELRSATARVRSLEGLLPVCAWCRKVRDDDGYWNDLEKYVVDRAGANLSHGICPDCAKRFVDPDEAGS
jgi:PAS domain S-box-containing protein